MGFNSAFKGLKLFKKTPGNGRLNNLNYPVLNVLRKSKIQMKNEQKSKNQMKNKKNPKFRLKMNKNPKCK